MKITAVTCVKNEGPFLLEWVAYNRLIGVTDFLFYSNDCTDGTDRLLDRLAEMGLVTHLPNPAQGRNYQMEALKDAKTQPVVTGADWVWIADVDEFLNIRVGGGTIPELIEAAGNPHAISVTFQFFANGGIERFEDRPVIAQFTRSHNPDLWCDQFSQEVKTLIRNDFPVKYYGAHRPFMKDGLKRHERPVWKDGSGRDVPWKFRATASKEWIRKFPARGARDLATLNHYALRSLDSYLVKNDRGDVNRENRAFDDRYWRERNDPAFEDRSILRMLPRLEEEIAALKADARLAALHEEAVAAHRAAAARLRARPDMAALAERLMALPTESPAERALIELLEGAA
ncbi:MAG: glycosyltransferase family 2 protein [Alphaproteobacteria bacterium]|nr:MAG: glycosyltransferase family 2 protein [Alphaproteobacteria bacterium]